MNKRSRAYLFLLLRALLVIFILGFVIQRYGGMTILHTLKSASPFWVILAGLSFFISIALGAYQWYLLIRYQGIEFSYMRSFSTYYAGLFLNNFLPTTVGGDALRIYEVQKNADFWGKAFAATFFDRLFGFFALSGFSLLAVLYLFWSGKLHGQVFSTLLLFVIVVTICFALSIALLLSRHLSSAIVTLFETLGLQRFAQSVNRIQEISLVYRQKWKSMGKILLIAAVVQILRINVHWFSALGLGCHINPLYFFCFIPIIALAGVIPLNIGGWGIPQSLGAYLYTLPGVLLVSQAELKPLSASLAFLPSVVGLVVMLFGGFYFVFSRSAKDNALAAKAE